MTVRSLCGLLTLALVACVSPLGANESLVLAKTEAKAAAPVSRDMFEAMKQGDIDVKFIAKSDRAAKVIIENKTKKPIELALPEAFAGVPILAQRGGGGFGGGGTGGGNQGLGGGLGGGAGGGGGAFSIPPEKIAKLDVPCLCLEHGKRDPSSSKPYEIRPVETFVDRPAVIELLVAFGNGKLDHGAAQAAAWHLNNDLSWEELSRKLTGTTRSAVRKPYFTQQQLKAAMAYSKEANRRAEEKAKSKKSDDEGSLSSESLSSSN